MSGTKIEMEPDVPVSQHEIIEVRMYEWPWMHPSIHLSAVGWFLKKRYWGVQETCFGSGVQVQVAAGDLTNCLVPAEAMDI